MSAKEKIILLVFCCCLFLSGCQIQPIDQTQPSDPNQSASLEQPATTAQPGTTIKPQSAPTTIRIGSLKGPTSMGLLYLMQDGGVLDEGMTDEGILPQNVIYEFQMATAADELLPLMVKGDLDIALVPANVASILYARTEGAICVIDVNTLGVLYMISAQPCESIADLKGRTIYLTGKGTTPDHVLQYLLAENGMDVRDCTLEYKSEAAEVAAMLAERPDDIGLLPQPFAMAACAQNEKLAVALDLNAEWEKLQGSGIVTGVTIVRRDFLQEHEEEVRLFLEDHKASAQAINDDPATGAVYAVEAGIVAKEPIAQKAIPYCNITCITGEKMREALQSYLEVLYGYAPESVGGALPGEGFYYIPE